MKYQYVIVFQFISTGVRYNLITTYKYSHSKEAILYCFDGTEDSFKVLYTFKIKPK